MSYMSKELGSAAGIGPEGEPVRVQVQTGFIEERINDRPVFLATATAYPSNALDHEPPKLYRGPFGDTPDSNLEAIIYQAGLYQSPVSSFVMSPAHRAMTDPKNQLIDIYGKVNRAVRRDLMTTRGGFDQIAISLGCLSLAEDISSRDRIDGSVTAIAPIGSDAYSRLGEEKFWELSNIKDLQTRVERALELDGASRNKWNLIANFGIRNAFAEGWTMLAKQRDIGSWAEATRGFSAEIFGNVRKVRGSIGKLVLTQAFAIGANVHIGPEFQKAREAGYTVNVIGGQDDKIYTRSKLLQTYTPGEEVDRVFLTPDVRHPYPTSKDGKRLLRAGARAHAGKAQEEETLIYPSQTRASSAMRLLSEI